MAETQRRRSLYLVLSVTINICLGTVYSWSVFRLPLEALLGIGSVASGLPYMVMLAMFSITLPFAGAALPRFGPRRLALVGGVLLGAGWILASRTATIGLLTVWWGVLGGIGVGVTYVVPLNIARAWFPDRRGLAMGVALSGFGMSPFVTAPLAEMALLRVGVRATFLIVGVVFAAIVPLLGSILTLPRGVSESRGATAGTTADAALSPGAMVRRPAFYALWFTFLLGSLIGLGAIAITAPWAQQVVGLSGATAAVAVSLLAVFNGIGRPLFGALTDHFGVRQTAMLAFVLTGAAAGMLILDTGNSLGLFAIAFAVFWLLLGGWLAIAPAATATLFGSRHYGTNYGIVFQAYGLGAVLGTAFSGGLNEVFGSYRAVLWPILGASVLGFLVGLVGFPRRR